MAEEVAQIKETWNLNAVHGAEPNPVGPGQGKWCPCRYRGHG